MMPGARQLPLDLAPHPALGREDFLSAPCNEPAFAMVMAPERWPGGRLALIGPEGAGKTHLAGVWAQAAGAARVAALEISSEAAPRLAAMGAVVVEDFDRMAASVAASDLRRVEDGLFHLYNLIGAEGRAVAADRPHAAIGLAAPHAGSRLAAGKRGGRSHRRTRRHAAFGGAGKALRGSSASDCR